MLGNCSTVSPKAYSFNGYMTKSAMVAFPPHRWTRMRMDERGFFHPRNRQNQRPSVSKRMTDGWLSSYNARKLHNNGTHASIAKPLGQVPHSNLWGCFQSTSILIAQSHLVIGNYSVTLLVVITNHENCNAKFYPRKFG